ncbi:hypothetical protein [Streptomyces sp. NRRL S-1521]|uniref:hypothetical protein n=1 Tax=Streptomyces sp. NRRL S-1521 TaxID=1609100 RepID=UPI0007482F1B|nr:hypothetical protein [Streptomyces sp. NRRL S-1521]KUL62421.1 hypothetical protein ADL30_05985 [Streptomyces sp. NRRL S-1521]
MDDDRQYRLTLTNAAGRPIATGWWTDRATAQWKFRTWIGSYGTIDGAHIRLTTQMTTAVSAS